MIGLLGPLAAAQAETWSSKLVKAPIALNSASPKFESIRLSGGGHLIPLFARSRRAGPIPYLMPSITPPVRLSVLASIVAIVVAMRLGFKVVVCIPAATYIMAMLSRWYSRALVS